VIDSKQKGLEPKPKRKQRTYEPTPEKLGMLCHDMYKRFGGCFTNLKGLARSEPEKNLLTDQLTELRTAMRELLQQAYDAKD